MAGKQKSGGGTRKYGRNKEKCKRYKDLGIRLKNKIRNFIKHNIAKNADEKTRQKLINDFKELQSNRK